MNLGTLVLLGALQTASPMTADTSKPDSIGFLRDSVVIPQIIDEGRAEFFEIPFPLKNTLTNEVTFFPLLALCRISTVVYKGGEVISAAYCREELSGMDVFALTGGVLEDGREFRGRYMIDWGRNDEVDACYEVEVSPRMVPSHELVGLGECQPHYLTLLKALRKEYEGRNAPPRILSDLE
ncbi:MAG TPA: hypothetical protein ENH99_02165 [Candidatus Pacearchaeota archaeon]|nr:hypothetical protein [Candidatus Pacearchaeota archaeon]